MRYFQNSPVLLLILGLISCQPEATSPLESETAPPQLEETTGLSIPFEKYRLDNGLEVVMHQDHSDPIVAIALLYHVGSARELPGRTGFAHLKQVVLPVSRIF